MHYIQGVDKNLFEQAVTAQLLAEITASGSSVAKLARELGYDYGTYWRWIKGRRSIPLPVLFETLDAIGVSPALLMQEAERRMKR